MKNHYHDSFFTDAYGAFRWDRNIGSRIGTWFLVSFSLEFDRMRGLISEPHITCVVDDFGNLVKVPS